MANTTFANLKIKCLRQAGNNYNSTDSTKLSIAGGLINDVLSQIQAEIRESPYFYDLENSVNTTADQAYVDLVDTNIIEIISVYEIASSDSRLGQLSRREYNSIHTDTTRESGVPDIGYSVSQLLTAGVNTYRIYLYPTPSSAQAIKYDYIKNIRFSVDGTGADAEYSPFPTTFDDLISAMFSPRFYGIISPSDNARIQTALAIEERAKRAYYDLLRTSVDKMHTIASRRGLTGAGFKVGDTF